MPTQPHESHAVKAARWMAENPRAMELFEALALKAVNSGRRFGIGLLAERVRWEFAIVYRDDDFKINNNHRAYIARELIRRHPHFADYLDLRAVQIERKAA